MARTLPKRTTALIAAMLLSLAMARPAGCAEIESYKYLETVGDTRQPIQWCVEKSENTRLLWQTRDEVSLIETRGPFDTARWHGRNTAEDTDISAFRQGDTIRIKGKLKGKAVDKTIAIDNAPWFQSMSWSLRRLVLSDDEQMELWTLRPDTMKAYKLVARKIGKEELQIGGKTVTGINIEIRLKGLLSPFWSSHYWFRETDGVWLRYKGVSEAAGNPALRIVYQGPSAPCDIAAAVLANSQPFPESHDMHGRTGG